MLLAFGDSHRNSAALALMVQIILRDRPEIFVHTGDNYSDFQYLKKQTKVKGYGVWGNCDLGIIFGAPEELVLEYKDKKILLTHGHTLGVKYSFRGLLDRARALAVDVVIFGHSHVQSAQREEGIWLINPGSIPLPRGGSQPGYAELRVVTGEIQVDLVQT